MTSYPISELHRWAIIASQLPENLSDPFYYGRKFHELERKQEEYDKFVDSIQSKIKALNKAHQQNLVQRMRALNTSFTHIETIDLMHGIKKTEETYDDY